jgi:hypothetical protein
MGVTFLLATSLTLLQVATGSESLALLFPWRISAFLVPVATAVILTRLVIAAAAWLDRPGAALASAAGIAALALALAGVALMAFRQGWQSSTEELPMMEFIRQNKQKGDVFLLPVEVPRLAATTRGSLSSDFKPLSAKKADERLIPLDLQAFRLVTGAPIFVDFKAIPYRDVDVVEWRERIEKSQHFYKSLRAGDLAAIRPELQRYGITALVVPADMVIKERDAEPVYRDRYFRVYRLDQVRNQDAAGGAPMTLAPSHR